MSNLMVAGGSCGWGFEVVVGVTPLVLGSGGLDLGPVGGALVGQGEREGPDDLVGPEGGGLDDGPRGGERVRIDDLVSRVGDRERERVR